jgi:methylglutaconyl-CoA hydratase
MSTLLISAGPVTTVTLNRPEVRNAFNEELIRELTAWAQSVPDDGSVRAVILQGEGSVFCAGADLNWMSRVVGYSREENIADVRQAAGLYYALDSLPVPLIGRIHGAALGGGAGLAAVCDVVVTSHDTIFGFTEVTLGIVPATISPYVMRKIGLSAARELCLNGTRFSATRAKEIGLAHEVVGANEMQEAIERHVSQFRLAAPSAVSATKRLLRDIYGHRPADVMALTVEAIALQRAAPEGQEGMRAFLEKRRPAWTRESTDGRTPNATTPRT